ncbi:MAG: type II toxin-antitoxin system Phd/YefM family antitoxin [Oscillospiraceae bacterium]
MYNTNITNARNNLYQLINMAIEDSEVVNVSTKIGNAVIISESDYNSLIETLYLSSDPVYKQSLIDGKNTPLSECFDESEVVW